MRDSGRSLSTVLALGVIVVAILGYAIGSSAGGGGGDHSSSDGPGTQLAGANVLLEAPSEWHVAGPAPSIPGLRLDEPVAFGQGSSASSAGLVTGSSSGGGTTPLPSAFVDDLAGIPQTAVVTLAHVEAYRYTKVRMRGFDRSLTLFAVPVPGGRTTVLGCYAPAGQKAAIATCETIVATLRPVGQTSSIALAPNAAYASGLSELVRKLETRRVALRAEMTGVGSKRTPAGELAAAFDSAATALAKLEPPLPIGQAQAELSRALLAARDAYRALAAATLPETYEAASKRVAAHEAAVSAALEDFSLLGYGDG